MKASVYLKEAKGNGKQGVSCICFRVRDKEIDIKVASGLLEKARVFDPFGHAGFDPSGKIRLTP